MFCVNFKSRKLIRPRLIAGITISFILIDAVETFAADKTTSGSTTPNKNTSIVVLEPSKGTDVPAPAASQTKSASETEAKESKFEELKFNRTLIIEGKVEKPQVQFTLLKEAPPEKEIRFETSFLQNILNLDRENNFKVGETYGRE